MEIAAKPGDIIKHPLYGKGTVIKVEATFFTLNFPNRGNMDISKRTEDLEWIPASENEPESSEEELTYSKLESTLRNLLNNFSDIQQIVPIGEKWQGGTLILQPADKSLKPKEIPIETFFHKIVMVRDRIRVMEQQINSILLFLECF